MATLLKYERVQADIAARLHGSGSDAATCIALHENFVALGTTRGRLWFVDHFGNDIGNLQPHTKARAGTRSRAASPHLIACSSIPRAATSPIDPLSRSFCAPPSFVVGLPAHRA